MKYRQGLLWTGLVAGVCAGTLVFSASITQAAQDDKVTISQLVDQVSAKVGEKLQVRRFARFELGKESE